jgi:hypothetical protein
MIKELKKVQEERKQDLKNTYEKLIAENKK